MNPKYFTSPEELQTVMDFVNKNGIHGGVKEVTLPQWGGPFRVPQMEGKAMHGILLRDDTEMNAGLCLDLIQKYPEFVVVSLLRSMM